MGLLLEGHNSAPGGRINIPCEIIVGHCLSRERGSVEGSNSTGDTQAHWPPEDPGRFSHLASKWLRQAEELAGLETQKGSLWHAYRRKWATERKHLPDVDMAAAGGWREPTSLKKTYQHADSVTMLVAAPGGSR